MNDKTINFSKSKDAIDVNIMLQSVATALEEKGYDPVDQIVGYIISGDPSYIPRHNNARNIIKMLERDQILEYLVRNAING